MIVIKAEGLEEHLKEVIIRILKEVSKTVKE